MKKVFHLVAVVAFSGLLLAGCASAVHIEKDETVDLNQYRSYAWVETQDQKDSVKATASDLTERKIRDAVDAELSRAGWRRSGKPDVLLSYDVLVENSVREDTRPVYSNSYTRYFYNPYRGRWSAIYYPSRFMGYHDRSYAVREGTVSISMIDARTEKTIWQGWTTAEVNSRNLTSKEIQSAVKSIFRKFDMVKN